MNMGAMNMGPMNMGAPMNYMGTTNIHPITGFGAPVQQPYSPWGYPQPVNDYMQQPVNIQQPVNMQQPVVFQQQQQQIN